MRLLLDTHVAIWWVLGDRRLSVTGRDLIIDHISSTTVSVVSVWEVAIKNSQQRRVPIGISPEQLAALIEEAGFALPPMSLPHALAVHRLPQEGGDPFDRLLVATAMADRYQFVTHDRALAAYGDHVTLV